MAYKKIIAYINAENEMASTVLKTVEKYSDEEADELYIYNYAKDTASRTEFLRLLQMVHDIVTIPFFVGCYVKSPEDVEKLFHTGASRLVIKEELFDEESLKEALQKFGQDKFMIELDSKGEFTGYERSVYWKQTGFGSILLKHIEDSKQLEENIGKSCLPVLIRDSLTRHMISDIININNIIGVATNYYRDKDLRKAKLGLQENGFLQSV